LDKYTPWASFKGVKAKSTAPKPSQRFIMPQHETFSKTALGTAKKKPSKVDLWIAAITPEGTFQQGTPPQIPDYGQAISWASTPDAPGKAALAPPGTAMIDPKDAGADVFYVHPSTYIGPSNWNEDIAVPMAATRSGEIVSELIMPGQAGFFSGCCRIYAPRYRQASLSAFFAPGDNGRAALDLAYGDIVRAFRHFIRYQNKGRPFIVAGHSQGACHLMRLLAEDFDPALKPQLIAAYLLGYRATEDVINSIKAVVSPAKDATTPGVFIAYDSFLEGTDARQQTDGAEHRFSEGWVPRRGKIITAINPVNWSCSKASQADEHLGFAVVSVNKPELLTTPFMPGPNIAVGLEANGMLGPIMPGVDAHLDGDGFLKISKPEQAFMNEGIFGGNYHNRDVALFYMNLRENAEARVAAFLRG
jgi:Protein of unknown function (DUF3089)